jgi:hypothetical protein
MIHPILRLLYAPDAANSAGGASPTAAPVTIDVPELPSAASGATTETVELSTPVTDAVYGIKGPADALGDDGVEEMERMEAQMEGRPVRERGPDGKFLPKGMKKSDEEILRGKEAKAKPTEKPAAKAPAKPAPKPVPIAKKPEPIPPAKVKIGEEEKTAEEWAREIAEARAKLAAGPAKPEAAPTPEPKEEPPAPKPEEIAAKEAARMTDFVKRESPKYKISPDELNTILAGLDDAPEALANVLVKVEASTRQWAAAEFNKVLTNISKNMAPLIEHHERLSEYKGDHSFLESNAEIRDHPKGYETYRKVKSDMAAGYARINAAIAAGTASPVDRAWHTIREAQTPEQLNAALARLTKDELAKLETPMEAPAPKPEAERKPHVSSAATKPFRGDRPGGGNAGLAVESEQARHVREMEQAGR